MLPILVPVGIWIGKAVIAKLIVGLKTATVAGVKTGIGLTVGSKAAASGIAWLL